MKKILFDQEIDFSLPESSYSCPIVGHVNITTSIYEGKIYAKFTRFSPVSNVETSIEDWLTGIRLQYIVSDALERKTKSVKQ